MLKHSDPQKVHKLIWRAVQLGSGVVLLWCCLVSSAAAQVSTEMPDAGAVTAARTEIGDGETSPVEPTITEEALPPETGECDVRITNSYKAHGLEPETVLPGIQVFCGLSRRWGGEIGVPMAYGEGENGRYGFADTVAAIKFVLHQQKRAFPAVVLGVESTFPTGNPQKGTGESGIEIQPFVAVLKQIRSFTLQANAGVGARHGSSEREYRVPWNVAVSYPVANTRWALMGELNGRHSFSAAASLSFAPGVHYAFGKDQYVAFAVPITVRGPDRRLGAVLQYQLPIRRKRSSE